MPDVPHVPPATISHHERTILSAILKSEAGSSGADDLIFTISTVIASVYAEGFTAGRVRGTDMHYAAQHFAEDRKKQAREQ
jgi:hypothetical protein